MKKSLPISLFFLSLVFLLAMCKKTQEPYQFDSNRLNLPAQPYLYDKPQVNDASLSNQIHSTLASAGVTNHGATLGRVLFYDPILSRTNTVSCASCHHQDKGFSDGQELSKGFDGAFTSRNAPGIGNLHAADAFFWDGREQSLEAMATKPIGNHVEMGLPETDVLIQKLESTSYYTNLFKNAFGTEKITEDRIGSAISQFLKSIVVVNAPTDAIEAFSWNTTNIDVFTDPNVQKGADLFFNNGCATCHTASFANSQTFIGFNSRFANIGLDVTSTDSGRLSGGVATFEWKVPDLHNVALTAPYMHDGRFKTLREVVDHYSDNVQANANLSWELGGPTGARKLNLTNEEKNALVAFLEAFTDPLVAHSEKYSNPFK
jgi:cytochrome c peroxidase